MVSEERAASIIFSKLLEDDSFMSYGRRNDDCVDYCIAAQLQHMDKEEAWTQLIDWAYKKHEEAVEHGHLSVVPQYLTELCEEHFERIWPYSKVWYKRNEWTEKLIGEYNFDEEAAHETTRGDE